MTRHLVLSAVAALVATLAFGAAATAAPRPNRKAPVVRHAAAPRAPAAEQVKVSWGSSWYDATVVARRGDQLLVNYAGWSKAFDEWVGPERVLRTLPERAPVAAAGAVQILWGNSWYPGSVVARKGDRFLVHYDGWSSAFDELVGPERVRFVVARR